MYRILSIDGGGLRGVIPLQWLNTLTTEFPTFMQKVDMVAGTSTGGIIACGLAAGMQPHEMVEFYLNEGEEIFRASMWRKAAAPLFLSKYLNDNLTRALTNVFGDRCVHSLQKKIVVCSFRLDGFDAGSGQRRWGPKFFNSWQDKDEQIVDVCLATSAAPTYFPMHGALVDGGIVANNPAMCAVCEAARRGAPVGEIEVLSLGTGKRPSFINHRDRDWGGVDWARHGLIDLLMEGGESIPDFQCRTLLDRRYTRVQAALTDELSPMDKPDNMDELLLFAQTANLDPARALAAAWTV